MVADLDGEKYIALLNESTIIVKLQMRDEVTKKSKGSVLAIFCKRRVASSSKYLGIITVVCNSISMTSLFATTSLYVIMKSLRSNVVCAIPHLATSLFWAQLLFQVWWIFVIIYFLVGFLKLMLNMLLNGPFESHNIVRKQPLFIFR